MSFYPISLTDSHTGLVWHGQVTPRYLAELQTGILPQLLHLVFFDTEDDNNVVSETIRSYEYGDTLTPENLAELSSVVAEVLEGLA